MNKIATFCPGKVDRLNFSFHGMLHSYIYTAIKARLNKLIAIKLNYLFN